MDLDRMRRYVEAADALHEAQQAVYEADRRLQAAQREFDLAARAVGAEQSAPPPSASSRGVITPEELRARTLKVNKKLRGENTIALCQALPGTITELVERTGIKKPTATTLLNRLTKDGIVKKTGEAPIPGYENRTTSVYDLAV